MVRRATIGYHVVSISFVCRILPFSTDVFIGSYWFSSSCKTLPNSLVSKFVGLILILIPTISRNVPQLTTIEATNFTLFASPFTTFCIIISDRCGQCTQIGIRLLVVVGVTLRYFLFLKRISLTSSPSCSRQLS